jgi:hypothetical protein
MQILGGKYDAATRGPADANFYRVRYYLPGAKRNQQTATVAGTGAVDASETQRMVGGDGGAEVASGAAAAANTSATATAGVPPAANAASAAPALAPGTSVEVRMIDPMDSNNNAAGKTYRASVTKAVTAGSVTIPQGAIATVIVMNNGANSTAQLSSITVNGQAIPTSSSSVAVTPNNGAVSAAAAQTVGSVVKLFGHHASAAAASGNQVAAIGAHIKLPSGAQLTFVLSAPQ